MPWISEVVNDMLKIQQNRGQTGIHNRRVVKAFLHHAFDDMSTKFG